MDITKRQITKIARELSKFTVRTLRADGIGPGELDIIHAVRKNPGITQAGVCRILGIDKGAAARQTANLEAKGYLTRAENPADGRSRLLFATDKAEGLKNSKVYVETSFYEWLLEPMTEREREEFARLLDMAYRRCRAESKADFPEMSKRMERGESNERTE
ncbi:MAG: MarR family winged helix-turn-helix transcriptional regulator [Candidatus Heteroscillospira sp.]|jgi:DNA-binding MarR family transcriptional regulator